MTAFHFFLNQNDQTWTDIVCTCLVIWQSQKCFLLYAFTPTPGRLPHKDNILRLTQNGRNFTNGIFKSMFLYAKCCVFIQISPKRPIDFTRVLVHVMALPLTENTPFSWWFILLMHIDVFTCVTRPKRVIISCLAQRTTVYNLIISGARQFSNTTCEMTNVSMNLINILCYFSNACRSDADTTWWNYPFKMPIHGEALQSDGLVQDCIISSVLTIEIFQSGTQPSTQLHKKQWQ